LKRIAKITLAGALLGMAAFAVMPRLFAAQRDETMADKEKNVSRNLTGVVSDGAGAPLAQSVVYLKNMKTLAVKSFIADDGGAYRFYGLSPNVDYQVYAEHNGMRSNPKTVSAFDARNKIEMNLKIEKK
jgi:protocatechuate 3,4-dioxygenase beta subunit